MRASVQSTFDRTRPAGRVGGGSPKPELRGVRSRIAPSRCTFASPPWRSSFRLWPPTWRPDAHPSLCSADDARSKMTTAPWQNRIVGHADVAPADLVPNPRNWRTHPAEQQRALTGALAEIGWVAEVLVNKTTGHVVDGHLRIELALDRNEPTVPVTFVELSEDEERLVLATLDPLAAMADAEAASLAELLTGLEPADEALRALLDDLARENGLDALRTSLVDPDDVPPVPDEADVYVKPRDLWTLGGHRLLCGDATNAGD